MLGWEYPPHVTGGLAAATVGIVDGLLARGVDVALVLPTASGVARRHGLTIADLGFLHAPGAYARAIDFGLGLFTAVQLYAERADRVADEVQFDVIHAHDWLTAPAAMRIAARTGRPWVMHVHATEFDRAGEHGHPGVETVERAGVRGADAVIAVSRYTKNLVVRRYGADAARVHVVHNSIAREGRWVSDVDEEDDRRPLILFLGRLTFQKGPDYFVEAAGLVLGERPDTLFVIAGEGDMRPRLMARVAELGIGRSVLFMGFVNPEDARRLYSAADLYVMPSVSEPFGITALEALAAGTPIIISKGAGVREVVRNALEVDFWDVRALASKILDTLAYPTLRKELGRRGRADLDRWTWEDAAERVAELYALLPRPTA